MIGFWQQLREGPRVFRVLLSIATACGLGVLFAWHEFAQKHEREEMFFSTNAMLWRTSETIYEVQRLSDDLLAYSEGRLSKFDLDQRFEILWSRMVQASQSRYGQSEVFRPFIGAIRGFLEEAEPYIYLPTVVKHPDVLRAVEQLDVIVLDARHAWAASFSTEDRQRKLFDAQVTNSQSALTSLFVGGMIILLMGYVLVEVYLGNRGQIKERRLREEANSASRAKSLFLANVSHEIRTPLNGILGMASELSNSQLDQDQRECVDVIEQSGALLLSTINDVLDLSKVEAGQLDLVEGQFDLHKILRIARDLYMARAREKKIALHLDWTSDLPANMRGDGRRLQQVIHNLVANAVKFTAKGDVTIFARPDVGGQIRIEGRDTGCGIAPEALGKILDPFVQANAEISQSYGGTGLGLSISREICQAMGGTLTVDSELGVGSCFTVLLPLVEMRDAARLVVEDAGTCYDSLQGSCILVVDDNQVNRLLLRRFLQSVACNVFEAESGEAALEMMATHHFNAVLMDIQMPGMGGVEAIRQIRAREQGQGETPTPVFAVTANVMAHQTKEYEQAGADAVLPKPVSRARVLAELVQVVSCGGGMFEAPKKPLPKPRKTG
jgi:signal transduction histidine kinase/CheY-like chemotaxis protein